MLFGHLGYEIKDTVIELFLRGEVAIKCDVQLGFRADPIDNQGGKGPDLVPCVAHHAVLPGAGDQSVCVASTQRAQQVGLGGKYRVACGPGEPGLPGHFGDGDGSATVANRALGGVEQLLGSQLAIVRSATGPASSSGSHRNYGIGCIQSFSRYSWRTPSHGLCGSALFGIRCGRCILPRLARCA
ncbi:Uncharacterised protein [Mycobacteroides abscessus subsp. abscessus]|nr:Uncharacterised protein [Mycobacteroides abscessus subsp. abscessus]